jgi:dihydrofolate reductase
MAIAGGTDVVRRCLNAGLVEEARLHLIPIVAATRQTDILAVDR